MTDFLSFFFPKSKVIEEPIDPREGIIVSDNWPKDDPDENIDFINKDLQKLQKLESKEEE